MSDIYHIDFETYSEADLKKVGAYRYAADPSTVVLMWAICKNDGPVHLWDNSRGLCHHADVADVADLEGLRARELFEEALNSHAPIYAHNAQFEEAITRHCLLSENANLNWFCTAAMCRHAGLPYSLNKACDELGLPDEFKKDRAGEALIRKFSIPDKKTGRRLMPQDDPGAWLKFKEYCRQDVIAEREVHKRLKTFDFPRSGLVYKWWRADRAINNTGIPIDVPAVKEAIKVVSTYEDRLSDEFKAIVGLNPTQTVKVLEWAKEQGYTEGNLQGATITDYLEDREPITPLEKALHIRRELSFAATKKLSKMIECAHPEDNKVRGCHLYYGAGTGRWSAKLIQPQNFKRPAFKDTPLVLQMLKEGKGRDIELLWGNPLEAISSTVRHFISFDGHSLFDADFASIEARIVCWLAGQEDALIEYRAGVDRYKRMASVVFNKPENEISSDERWLGKGAILGCGFGMGATKFFEQSSKMAKIYNISGIPITPDIFNRAHAAWRARHKKVVNFWYECEREMARAVMNKGRVFSAGKHLKFKCDYDRHCGILYLQMRLPSGRTINYPKPSVDVKGDITYYGAIPMTARWGRVSLYGGKIVENACQAIAADLMANGASNALDKGFDVFMLVHDQSLAKKDVAKQQKLEDFIACMTDAPEWAEGLPVEVEGSEQHFYTK